MNKNTEKEKVDLAIIIPFAGEYPQVLFTIQAIAQSLVQTEINFEIIAIDNFCQQLIDQWDDANNRAAKKVYQEMINPKKEKGLINDITDLDFKAGFDLVPKCHQNNKSGDAIKAAAGKNPWLTYMSFDERLSHWECKRLACEATEADTFLFIDAHCIPSFGIDKMFRVYSHYFRHEGTFHMPLTYKILEWHRLIYKLSIQNHMWGYSFSSFDPKAYDEVNPPEVPCMSTCGMMISREVYDQIGGWPKEMTMYGGGENFINFALATTGFKKWIFPPVTLHHHGEGRDYHYTYDGMLWNRLLAHYLFGGEQYLLNLAKVSKGKIEVLKDMVLRIIENEDHTKHRAIIKNNTRIDLETWRQGWEV